MTDSSFSKRKTGTNGNQQVINALVEEKFNDIMGMLREIKEQTTKTNGRVTTLEVEKAVLAGQLSVLKWTMAAIIAPLIVTAIIYAASIIF